MHELFFVYSPKKSVPLGLVGSGFMIPDHQNHVATKKQLNPIWTRLYWHVINLRCDMIRVIVIAFLTLQLLSPPCSLKRLMYGLSAGTKQETAVGRKPLFHR